MELHQTNRILNNLLHLILEVHTVISNVNRTHNKVSGTYDSTLHTV